MIKLVGISALGLGPPSTNTAKSLRKRLLRAGLDPDVVIRALRSKVARPEQSLAQADWNEWAALTGKR